MLLTASPVKNIAELLKLSLARVAHPVGFILRFWHSGGRSSLRRRMQAPPNDRSSYRPLASRSAAAEATYKRSCRASFRAFEFSEL